MLILFVFEFHYLMIRIKKFLSLSILMFCGLVGVLLPTCFSVAQNYGPTEDDLKGKSFRFLMPNHALYLYAIIEKNTYIISFDGNGWVWSMSIMNMVYDEKENLLPNIFTKNWYTFRWWSTSKTWPVEYFDQAEVKNLTIENWGEVILYAQWDEDWTSYTVEYLLENLAWTWYDLVDTGSMYGAVWTGIIMTWKIYTWFTLQTWVEVSITSGWIVQYRYTRNTYNLTVKDRDKVLINTWIKYWADILLPVDNPTWTWNVFSWWDNLPADGKMPANNLIITSSWNYGVHTITFNTNWWTEVPPITGNYGDDVQTPLIPTREWYEFVWWSPDLPDEIPNDDIVVTAIWREIKPEDKWKWWSGWWRKDSTEDTDTSWDDQHWSAKDQNQPWRWMVDLDVFFAYMWAHDMWIIGTSWEESDPDGYVTRWAMAEMVVKFSENILDRETPEIIPAKCAWWDADSEWKTPERKVYAEKACALWVMWIRMKDFMPNKILDRAEFGTILSRLLWWDKYDVVDATKSKPYYTKHLAALSENKIMTQIEDPESKKELRKWAWLMLMRSRIEHIEEK